MRHGLLTVLILIGLIAGVIVGQLLFDPDAPLSREHWSYVLGNLLLIKPLMLMIVPIVFLSVTVGVCSIGDPSKLGVVGGSTILYYLITMVLAVTLGTTLVTWIQPGAIDEADRVNLRDEGEQRYRGSDVEATVRSAVTPAADADATPDGEASDPASDTGGGELLGNAFMNVLDQMIPSNIIREMAAGRTLGIIGFALLFGLALAAGGDKTEYARQVLESFFDAVMRMVLWIIWLTPIGVFLLMIYTVGSIGIKTLLGPISLYIVVVLSGLAIHGLIVLPLILFVFTRRNPYRFMWRMRRALLTAFGTDSSAATLPVTIETARNEGECSKRASNFVLPLGATINMDGTALYEAVAVVFLFQLYGIDLSFSQLLVVVVTATLAAIGAAGIPSAGLVMMVIVVTAVNTSLGASGTPPLDLAAIGVIYGVDRVVDMCRTTVNVWGDAVGAKLITRIAPDIEEEMEAALG